MIIRSPSSNATASRANACSSSPRACCTAWRRRRSEQLWRTAGFRCSRCKEDHEGLPFSYGSPAPSAWFDVPEAERAARGSLSSDQCILDDKLFFLLGQLELPVIGAAEPFSWCVWVSVSESNFSRASALWQTKGRESEPPCFAWLQTELPYPGGTLNLKCRVHTREVGVRPFVELEPTDHPLALEQRNGITLERVQEIAESVLHGMPPPKV